MSNSFWDGFEKEAAIDWFYRSRNKTLDQLEKEMGPKYERKHLKSYVKRLRPWESKVPTNQWSKDIRRLYDKKEHYNKLQKGLKATAPGSKEEADFLKKHKKQLDKRLISWLKDGRGTIKQYRGGS